MSSTSNDWFVVELTPYGTIHLYGPVTKYDAIDLADQLTEADASEEYIYEAVKPLPVTELREGVS